MEEGSIDTGDATPKETHQMLRTETVQLSTGRVGWIEWNAFGPTYRTWDKPGYLNRAEAEELRAAVDFDAWTVRYEDAKVQAEQAKAEKEATEAKRAEELAALRALAETKGQALYLRSGAVPASGRSYNHRDGYAEPGVSVYRAWYLSKTRQLVIDVRGMDAVSSMCILYDGDRPLYEVFGEALGATGSDGEPLLSVTSSRPLRKRWETMQLVS